MIATSALEEEAARRRLNATTAGRAVLEQMDVEARYRNAHATEDMSAAERDKADLDRELLVRRLMNGEGR